MMGSVTALAIALPLLGCGGGGTGGSNSSGGGTLTGTRAYYETAGEVYGTFEVLGSPLSTMWLNSTLKIVRPNEAVYLYMGETNPDRYYITGCLPQGASKNHEFYYRYDGTPDQWHSGTANVRMYFSYPTADTIKATVYRRGGAIISQAMGQDRGNGFKFQPIPSLTKSNTTQTLSASEEKSILAAQSVIIIIIGDDDYKYTDPPTSGGGVPFSTIKATEQKKMTLLHNDTASNRIYAALGQLSISELSASLGINATDATGAQDLIRWWALTNGLSRDPLANINHSFIQPSPGIAYEPTY